MEYEQRRPEYLTIKQAATRYDVGRGKLHRLIRLGRLDTVKDPRDARATLVRIEDLDNVFHFPSEHVSVSQAIEGAGEESMGKLTAEMRASVDALRARIYADYGVGEDSARIIREERDKRGQRVDQAVSESHAGPERPE